MAAEGKSGSHFKVWRSSNVTVVIAISVIVLLTINIYPECMLLQVLLCILLYSDLVMECTRASPVTRQDRHGGTGAAEPGSN